MGVRLDDAARILSERDAGAIQGLLLAFVPTMIVIAMVAPLPIIPELMRVFAREPDIEALASLAIVLPTLGIAVSSIGAGVLGEWIGRRRLLILSTALFSVAAILPFWLASFQLILASRALTGLALGGMITAAVGLTGDYFTGSARQRWLAAQGGVPAAAAVVTAAASGALGEIDWRLPFLLPTAGFVLLAGLILFPADIAATGLTQDNATPQLDEPTPWTALAVVFALAIVGSLVIFPPAYELGLLLQEKALGSTMLTGLTTAVLASGAVAGAFGLNLVRGWPPPVKIAGAFALTAIGVILIALTTQVVPIMTGAALIGIAQGMIVPVLSAWLLDKTPESARGRIVGVFQTVLYVAQAGAPLLARAIAVEYGSASQTMRCYAIAAAVAAVVVLMMMMLRPRPAPR